MYCREELRYVTVKQKRNTVNISGALEIGSPIGYLVDTGGHRQFAHVIGIEVAVLICHREIKGFHGVPCYSIVLCLQREIHSEQKGNQRMKESFTNLKPKEKWIQKKSGYVLMDDALSYPCMH